jgi:hypothetical protein
VSTKAGQLHQAEKEGTTPGEIARRKGLAASGLADTSADNTAKFIQQILEKAIAARMAAIKASLDKPLQQGLTLGHLAPYIESLTYEYDLLQEIANSNWTEVQNLVIDMGESKKFTEQQVQFFLSQSGIDRGMQDTLTNIFREAQQGLYGKPYLVFGWKTLQKATPGIIKGVSIALAVTAAVGTAGLLWAPSSAIVTSTLGGIGVSSITTGCVVSSVALDEGSKAVNYVRIYNAYKRGEITRDKVDPISLDTG